MKTLPLLLTSATVLLFLLLLLPIPSQNTSADTKRISVVFDGYEGNTYFFSDENHRAITITGDDALPLEGIDLIEGDYVDHTFEIEIMQGQDVSLLETKDVKNIKLQSQP